MSGAQTPQNKDRKLEKSLTDKIIDDYLENTEGWLRAILRMCIFSLAHLDGQPVFVIECPNQAVAKRLSRKTNTFRGIVYFLTDNFDSSDRTLLCYQETKDGTWCCFDTNTRSWKKLSNLRSRTASTDG
ncbi:MAG: transcription antitermination protein NusB [Desmonostoc vinosum HA7617-LM4]|jgi:hypothetical protein|nr:transcription antitermination protein NusB [Desmonostoc vinosum HA7617-LM4]